MKANVEQKKNSMCVSGLTIAFISFPDQKTKNVLTIGNNGHHSFLMLNIAFFLLHLTHFVSQILTN